MHVEIATTAVIPEWLDLIREAEPVMQAPMADDPAFQDFMKRKLAQHEVLIVRDDFTSPSFMGAIVISHNNNRISWFAVHERYRRRGVGSMLLKAAIEELDSTKPVEVTTFQESYFDGIPARRTYQKFGFVDVDLSLSMNGYPRSLMKKFPLKTPE